MTQSTGKHTPGKFIQIATLTATMGVNDCGIFALDDNGYVWHYEGEEKGWERFTDKRAIQSASSAPQKESK